MKQRLLYAILMLFGVFSMAKAAGPASYIKVVPVSLAAGATAGTVTFTNATSIGVYSDATLATPIPGISVPGDVVTLPTDGTTYYIGFDAALNEDATKKAVGITVDGKVSSANLTTSETISELTFKNNGELEWLSVDGAPNLKQLSCSGNKLRTIPKKGTIATYSVGVQTPSEGALKWCSVDGQPSNTSIDLTIDKLQYLVSESNTPAMFSTSYNVTDYSYKNWTVKNSVGKYETVSGENMPQAASIYRYTFKNPSTGVYASQGDFKTDLEFASSHPDYPGVTIKGIPVKVKDPEFTITSEVLSKDASGNATGTISIAKVDDGSTTSITGNELKNLPKETLLQITFAGLSGYEFDKDAFLRDGYAGIKDLSWINNVLSCKIKGDVDPVLKASFKGQPITVTYTSVYNEGTVSVSIKDGPTVASGTTIPYGSILEISPVPGPGYKVESVKYNNVLVSDPDGKYFTNPITENISIYVTFSSTVTTKAVTFQSFEETVLKWNVVSGGSWTDGGYVTYNVLPGSEVVFSATPQGNYSLVKVLMNGQAITPESTNYYRFAMPETDVAITAEVKQLQTMTITSSCTTAPAAQTYVYDGNLKSFTDYTITVDGVTIPNSSVTNLKIEYKVSGASVDTYTEDPRKDCGLYGIHLSKPADDTYASVAQQTFYMRITPATPSVTLPTSVEVKKKTVKVNNVDEVQYYYAQTGAKVNGNLPYKIEFVKEMEQESNPEVLYEKESADAAKAVKSTTDAHQVYINPSLIPQNYFHQFSGCLLTITY